MWTGAKACGHGQCWPNQQRCYGDSGGLMEEKVVIKEECMHESNSFNEWDPGWESSARIKGRGFKP